MASSESSRFEGLAPVQLDASDVLAGVTLSAAAHWNQTADDWHLFTSHGHAIGWRTGQSELVATAATLPYQGGLEGGLSWISMVLVAEAWQHRGLATRLLQDCVQHLQASGSVPVLDATPAGEAVYQRLGFGRGFELQRWDLAPAARETDAAIPHAVPVLSPSVEELTGSEAVSVIAALDRETTGLDRSVLLADLLGRQASRAWVFLDARRRATGFALAREGRSATQIGPVIAAGAQQAIALVKAALGAVRGRVLIDAPTARTEFAAWLAQRGFKVQRGFSRMALAAVLPLNVRHAPATLYAIAGPEFG